jgi:hypothetical protein
MKIFRNCFGLISIIVSSAIIIIIITIADSFKFKRDDFTLHLMFIFNLGREEVHFRDSDLC